MQLQKFLESKTGIAVELILFFGISVSTLPLGIVMPALILLSIGSMKVRKLKSINFGFDKKDFTYKKIFLGILSALFYMAVFYYLIDPLLTTTTSVSIEGIFKTKGNLQNLILWLIVSWIVGAFYEELIFRGYLINRLLDLLGKNSAAIITSIILSATAFGFIHYYQNMHGVISAGTIGLFQGIIYFVDRKKLTIPAIAHGVFDTIAFIKLFWGN